MYIKYLETTPLLLTTNPRVLTLIVGREPGVRRKPRLRVEAAMSETWPRLQLIRVMADRTPLFWAVRDEPWDEHANFVRGELPARSCVLPPVTMADLRACKAGPRTEAWWNHWLHYFAKALGAAHDGILQNGAYVLAALREPIEARIESLTTKPQLDGIAHIELTRRLSSIDDGRVKMWRKRAAEGIPPVLCYDWMCLPGPLLLDGHDRLLAMAAEGVPQLALQLTPISFGGRGRKVVGSLSFGGTLEDHRYGVGRLHPLPGGASVWRREVRGRLWAVRDQLKERSPARRLLDGMEDAG